MLIFEILSADLFDFVCTNLHLMITALISRCIILVFAILHPAYKSYKSLRQKNQKDILTWLMYWIVFAIYTAIETVTDMILCWIPFYYEMKIFLILWMVLPITKGYSLIFRKLIHPELLKHETEIDNIIEKATESGYNTILNFGAKGIHFAASTVLTTAVKGQQMLAARSLSLGDLSFGRRSSMSDSPSDQAFGAFDELDAAIAGHGDESGVRLKQRTRIKRQTYDTGTFPRRRAHPKELNIVPEEEGGSDTESYDRWRKDKYNVSQIYLDSLSLKRSSYPTYRRTQSDMTEDRLRTKPPMPRAQMD